MSESDKLSPFQKRFGADFKGKIIPFGAYITHMPSSDKKLAELSKYGSKQLPAIFIGYHLHAGGRWSGDYLVVDADNYRKED